MLYVKYCLCVDSNRKPLASEATSQPTEPQPLALDSYVKQDWERVCHNVLSTIYLLKCSTIRQVQPPPKKKVPKDGFFRLKWRRPISILGNQMTKNIQEQDTKDANQCRQNNLTAIAIHNIPKKMVWLVTKQTNKHVIWLHMTFCFYSFF